MFARLTLTSAITFILVKPVASSALHTLELPELSSEYVPELSACVPACVPATSTDCCTGVQLEDEIRGAVVNLDDKEYKPSVEHAYSSVVDRLKKQEKAVPIVGLALAPSAQELRDLQKRASEAQKHRQKLSVDSLLPVELVLSYSGLSELNFPAASQV